MTEESITIAQLLDSIKTEKTSMKAAFEAVDVSVGDTPFTGYSELIYNIRRYKEPNPSSMWNTVYTIKNDIQEGYAAKVLYLFQDASASTALSGANAYKTSDGSFYTADTDHTWDASKDEVVDGAHALRYVIAYFTDPSITAIPELQGCVKMTVKGAVLSECSNLFAQKFPNLVEIEFVDTTVTATDFTAMFMGMQSLHSVKGLDTSSGTNFSGMFSMCPELVYTPDLDLSNGEQFAYMYAYCTSLVKTRDLNTGKGVNFAYMFTQSPNLERVGSIDTSNAEITQVMFAYCPKLTTVGVMPLSNVSSYNGMFQGCTALSHIGGFPGLKVDLNIAQSMSTSITRDSILNIIEGLDPETPGTQTIGADNLTRVTASDLDKAAAKGWTLV